MVSENESPRHGATDSEEAHRIQGMPTAPSDGQKSNTTWYRPPPPTTETFVLSLRKQDYRRLQQANLSPEAKAAMAYLRVRTA
jgi:hypothetical protein